MSAANRIALIALVLAAAACSRNGAANNAAADNSAMDVETLPPDESDTVPTNELDNGVDQPDAATGDLNSD